VRDIKIANDHTIVQSFILDPVVVVLLENKTIQVYQYELNQLKAMDILQPDVSSLYYTIYCYMSAEVSSTINFFNLHRNCKLIWK
jgi:hypothetical protein